MSIQIHPYLLARLVAVQAAFNQPGYKMALPVAPHTSKQTARKGNDWGAILKKEEEDKDGEGGGGSMKGLRGKQAEYAKAAMRKLSRR